MTNSSPSSLVIDLGSTNDVFIRMFQYLFDSGSGIWIWEPEEGNIYFNQAYMTMLGYKVHEFPYHINTWIQLIHENDRDATIAYQMNIINSPDLGDFFESRFRLRTADGSYRWVVGKGFVICRDTNGKAIRLVGMHMDLLNMDESWKQISLDYERMYFALEASKDGFWDWDPISNDIYYSQRCYEMLGYDYESFPNNLHDWGKLVHPEDVSPTLEHQMLYINSPRLGDSFNSIYRILAADGTYKWILGRGKIVRRNAEGKAVRAIGMHTDITEMQHAQESLLKLINHDGLTNLHSRYYLEAELEKIRPANHPVSIIYADIDGLKIINDYLGHNYGDKVLCAAAKIIRQVIRFNDIATRIGGDEILIVLQLCPEDAAKKISLKLKDLLNKYNAIPENIPLYMSCGLCTAPKGSLVQDAITTADKNMLEEKEKTRVQNRLKIRTWIENHLQHAIELKDIRTGGS